MNSTARRRARPPDLVITRNGAKVVAVPLAPRMASAVDVATGGRTKSRSSWLPLGGIWTDTARAGVRRIAPRAGITKPVAQHTRRHAFITPSPPRAGGVPFRPQSRS